MLATLFLSGCSGGGGDPVVAPTAPTYTISATVSGLAPGGTVTLQNNAADTNSRTADGRFSFATPLPGNGSYAVTVSSQPAGQTCTVSNGSGSGVSADVSNVQVTCSANTYNVGGTVSGLAPGATLTLQNNAADATTRTADGIFSFRVPVAFGSGYAVTVSTQPAGQTCTVANASGAGVTANVVDVQVACSVDTYAIGGTVSGLGVGTTVTLQNNAADPTTVAANGSFRFATPVVANGGYAVTVGTQPVGQTCTVGNGTGVGLASNVTNVQVTCAVNGYTIGGTISGLASGRSVTLRNNAADPTTVAADGSIGFATPVAFNGSYAVTVGTQPVGQTCTVINGAGAGVTANVNNVVVTCVNRALFAYVSNVSSSNISQYSVGADGKLVPLSPATVATSTEPYGITVDPTGRYAYATGFASNTVSQYTIGVDGRLTPMGIATVATGRVPTVIVVDPTGHYAYLTNLDDDTVSQYSLGAGGALTPLTPATVGTGSHPFGITVDPTGRFVYVTNLNDLTVSQYSIGPNGALVALSVSTVATEAGPFRVTVSPSGRYAYVANIGTNTVSQYSIAADGALAPLSPASVAIGPGPSSVAIDPSGGYAYVTADGGNFVAQFSVNADGTLAPLNPASLATGNNPTAAAVDPTGRYVYLANLNSASVAQYSIGAGGLLMALSPDTVGAGSLPYALVMTFGP
ncbi:beta-propeller fold lactonase family protein [Variovorax sp. LT2P21]|uniref:beta-propeller fold lactonase family protein n=1 Tax=Variovorax sp. LT2P21 TaxID=3443731 RepID=UPI003F450B4A